MKVSFSVVIPVMGESAIITQTIDHLLRTGSGVTLEVIVVDGDSEGRTIGSIQNREIIKVLSHKGRGAQMNKGASAAQGEILLFLHSDTELPDNAFETVSAAMEDDRYAGGAFDLGIKSDRSVYRLIEKLANIRTHLTRVPYGDQAIFIKREFFRKIEGFKDIPIMEDVDLMRRIRKAGFKICIIPQKVRTSARRWEEEGVAYCTLRNWALISLYSVGVSPGKLVRFYHKNRKE